MHRYVATLSCILFICFLFREDVKNEESSSGALWIPFFWMFLAESRYVSAWFRLSGPTSLVDASLEGSPVDAAIFFLLIAAGIYILSKRNINWAHLFTQNKIICLYFLYCGISILWSDLPFVALKRWTKELGNPILALVILTDDRGYEAIGLLLRRLAFLALPLSVLFIMYYPNLGRAYHIDGSPMCTGVGTEKNALGFICLTSGVYFAWDFLLVRKDIFGSLSLRQKILQFILVAMTAWLLHMSQSSTSLACLCIGVSLLLTSRIPMIARKPSRIIVLLVAVFSLSFALDTTLNVRDYVFEILGRDSTLTNRVYIWDALKQIAVNPIVGFGFMSFWAGDRLNLIFNQMGAQGVQAHNGYLEQYLNLGLVGVAFILLIVVTGLIKTSRHLSIDYPSAMLRLCFIVIAVFYNYTEACFYGVNNMWLLLLVAAIDIPNQQILDNDPLRTNSPMNWCFKASRDERFKDGNRSVGGIPQCIRLRFFAFLVRKHGTSSPRSDIRRCKDVNKAPWDRPQFCEDAWTHGKPSSFMKQVSRPWSRRFWKWMPR